MSSQELNKESTHFNEAQQKACAYITFHEESGGVSEFFQEVETLNVCLSPFTKSSEANDSSSAISSNVSFTDSAPTFWLKFSILVVPGMGNTSFPW